MQINSQIEVIFTFIFSVSSSPDPSPGPGPGSILSPPGEEQGIKTRTVLNFTQDYLPGCLNKPRKQVAVKQNIITMHIAQIEQCQS